MKDVAVNILAWVSQFTASRPLGARAREQSCGLVDGHAQLQQILLSHFPKWLCPPTFHQHRVNIRVFQMWRNSSIGIFPLFHFCLSHECVEVLHCNFTCISLKI